MSASKEPIDIARTLSFSMMSVIFFRTSRPRSRRRTLGQRTGVSVDPPVRPQVQIRVVQLTIDVLQVQAPSPLSRMIASIVSASRISRTSTPPRSDRLSPFAMCPAFPGSDYYGESVAIGLCARRRSWASSPSHVRAWFRPSTHPYTRGAPRYLTARACRSRQREVRRTRWRRHAVSSLRVSFVTGLRLARSGLDFKLLCRKPVNRRPSRLVS